MKNRPFNAQSDLQATLSQGYQQLSHQKREWDRYGDSGFE